MKKIQIIYAVIIAILMAVIMVAQLCHGSFIGFIAFGTMFIMALGGVGLAIDEYKDEDK